MSSPLISVIAGLAVGIGFIMMFILVSPFHPNDPINIKLNEEWDKEGQQKAVDTLLTDRSLRSFAAGRDLEVWAFNPSLGHNTALNRNFDCGENDDLCSIIGLRERNDDGSLNCTLIAFVNIKTNEVDSVNYGIPCNWFLWTQ